MDYLKIRELYHSQLYKEKARFVSQYGIINQDFYEDLPYIVRSVLDDIKWRFRQEDWFPEAWEKYRQHVLEAGLGGEIKMPGYVFKPYLEQYVDEHSGEFDNNLRECRYSDMEIGEYLSHHGIKGQRWGIRRFQNEDGSLTAEGKARYQVNDYTGEMSEAGKKLYKKDQKDVKISNRSTGKQAVVGGVKGGAAAYAGGVAAAAALTAIGAIALSKAQKSGTLDDATRIGSKYVKLLETSGKIYKVAVPAAAAVGAGVAVKKQQKSREKIGYQKFD